MIDVVLAVCVAVAAVATVYGLYFVIMALPLSPLPRQPDPASDAVHRFAVLVFAKDEAAVIGQLVASLRTQDYPADAFDVFVTADNCTDDTAAVAAGGGAIVWERADPDQVGKGHALRWFFDRFRVECAGRYDACAVFDADNVVDPGFLAAINRELNRGHEIVIGRRLPKNPADSAVAGASAVFWLFQTRMFHAGRARRGLPCTSVGGTGFAFKVDVLPNGRWHTRSTSEDIEFALHSIADGHSIALTYDAVFYDEQPLTWGQSIKQRFRWTVGGLQMLRYGTPRLLRTFRRRWRTNYDALIFSVGALESGLSLVASALIMVVVGVKTGQWPLLGASMAVGCVVSYLAVAVVAWVTLRLERQWWDGAWRAVAAFPIYMATWMAMYLVVLFYHSPRWHTIPHTRALSLEEIAPTAR